MTYTSRVQNFFLLFSLLFFFFLRHLYQPSAPPGLGPVNFSSSTEMVAASVTGSLSFVRSWDRQVQERLGSVGLFLPTPVRLFRESRSRASVRVDMFRHSDGVSSGRPPVIKALSDRRETHETVAVRGGVDDGRGPVPL